MYIYKIVYDTEALGKQALIDKGVWEEVTEEGVTTMNYLGGTQAVVNIGKVVETPAVVDDEGNITTPAVYYPGWAYDIMTTQSVDFASNLVLPGDNAAHAFLGWPRNTDSYSEETGE
tara:strand:- start:961 stop:1311 length:351 start_codon:yes stop_codon:yes gene_type:complete